MNTESNPHLTDLANQLVARVSQSKNVLIGTHLNPDGDAIGSALAVSQWLDNLGIANEVICNNLPPGYLQFLPGCAKVRLQPERAGHDMGIIVDLDSLERLGSCRPYFEALPFLALIDHHIPHEKPGDLRIVEKHAPATASILADIIPDIDPAMALCLLTGLVTDTGGFRFPNTSARSLHQAAELVEKGANLSLVMSECFLNRDEPAIHLLGRVLANMKISCGGRLAGAVLQPGWFIELGALEEHTEGIVNEILSIRTVQAAFVLRQGKFGKVKGSLRSKGDIDMAKIAQGIGGGGHKNAAGVTIEASLEEAERIVERAIAEVLE